MSFLPTVRHMGMAYLFHLFLCALELPYLHPVKLTPHLAPALGRRDNTRQGHICVPTVNDTIIRTYVIIPYTSQPSI